jgi:hypothetical protein
MSGPFSMVVIPVPSQVNGKIIVLSSIRGGRAGMAASSFWLLRGAGPP